LTHSCMRPTMNVGASSQANRIPTGRNGFEFWSCRAELKAGLA
jgi:hypothetical protein